MKMLKSIGCAGLMTALGFLTGCSTPTTRIHANPTAFAQLSPDQQSLVQQGKVVAGFTAAAVRLALGDPDRVTLRQRNGSKSETWYYFDFELEDSPDPVFYFRGNGGWRGEYNYGIGAYSFPPVRIWYTHYRVQLDNNLVTGVAIDSR
jgi:hypothetical protein